MSCVRSRGIAPASFITEIVEESLPVIHAMVAASKNIKSDKIEAFEALSEALASVLSAGSDAQLDLIEQTRKLRRTAGVVGKRRKRPE